MNEETKRSIIQMAGGAFIERVDYEMPAIMENIMDMNTKATAKRKLVVEIEFVADDNRTNIVANVTVKKTLAPTNPMRTTLYVSGADHTGDIQVTEMVPQIRGQMNLDGEEQSAPPMLRLIKNY